MSTDQHKDDKKSPYEQENKDAEKLAEELEAPFGAEKIGKEAFETAKKDKSKKGGNH